MYGVAWPGPLRSLLDAELQKRIISGSCALQGLDKRVLGRRDAGVFVRAVRHYGLQVCACHTVLDCAPALSPRCL